MEVDKRLFVIGCARSGTTLVQAMLASHSQIHGFPETFFFLDGNFSRKHSLSPRTTYRRFRAAHYAYSSAMHRIGEGNHRISPLLTPDQVARTFVRYLDEISLGQNKRIWSEKTPGHINRIEVISRIVPGAMFVHVLRDGRDVVASLEHLYRLKALDDEVLGSAWPLHESIRRWNDAIYISSRYRGAPNHFFLEYESLITNPGNVLQALARFLDFEYEPAMAQYRDHAKSVLGKDVDQSWRTDVLNPLRSTHLKKYEFVFSRQEQGRLELQLVNQGRIDSALVEN